MNQEGCSIAYIRSLMFMLDCGSSIAFSLLLIRMSLILTSSAKLNYRIYSIYVIVQFTFSDLYITSVGPFFQEDKLDIMSSQNDMVCMQIVFKEALSARSALFNRICI